MLLDVIKVVYNSGYKLIVTFENGEEKLVDLKDRLIGPIFEPLKDINYFKKVYVDKESGTIAWSNAKSDRDIYEIRIPI